MEKVILSLTDCEARALKVAAGIYKHARLYGIPRGGIPAAYLVHQFMPETKVVYSRDEADIYIDDLIDSGHTASRFNDKPFLALFNKQEDFSIKGKWLVFPWEINEDADKSATDIIVRTLQYIGEDPLRDGLRETPERVVRSWQQLYAGYKQDPKDILSRTFTNEEKYDEMVILKDIEFYSTCEHHLLPFFGKVHIAYLPIEKVIGISKLARLVDCFARRLQIQERLTQQITGAIDEYLKPLGVACFIEARHLCMMARGVEKQNSIMITSSIRGAFKEKDAARLEFLLLKR